MRQSKTNLGGICDSDVVYLRDVSMDGLGMVPLGRVMADFSRNYCPFTEEPRVVAGTDLPLKSDNQSS